MARMMARILYIVSSSIYSIFPIPLHKTWDTPTYIRNIPDYSTDISNFPNYPIKIKWYDLYTILYHDMTSTPYMPDHPRPFQGVSIEIS